MKVGHIFEIHEIDGAAPHLVAQQHADAMLDEGNLEPGEERHVVVFDDRNFKGLYKVTAEAKVEKVL